MRDRPHLSSLFLPFALAAALLAAACQQIPAGPGEPVLSCEQARAYKETGTASWYGRAHHGRRTASGQIFNMNALTAAHRQLPFGTTIKVTNPDTGKSATLVVNDRGPFVAGRILDVSYRGAQDLGFVQAGTATVRIETIAAC